MTESDFRTDERNGNKREEEYIEIHSNPLCRVPWCCRYLCGIIIVQLFAASERLALPSSPFLTYPSPHSSCRLNFFFFRCTRCTLTNAISSRREWLRFFSFLTYDSERPMIQGYFPSRLSDYMRFSCGEKRFVCIYILTLMGYRMFDLVSESVSCISCTCSTFDDLCPFSSSDFRVLRRVIIFWSLYY